MVLTPWLTVDDLPADRPTLPGDPEQQAQAWRHLIDATTAALWALSGRRWGGQREVTVEVWAPPGECCDPCRPRAVRLPHRDARQLTAVAGPDGATLDAADYLIDRGGYLTAAPGRVARMPTTGRSLTLTYVVGRNPPPDAVAHAAALAVELARATVDPDASRLPDNVTSITRQGVTMTYQSAQTIIASGSTGLYAVDLWLATVNPTRQRRPPRAYSPDTDARYRILDPGGTP